ncbi:MAG: DUF1080 domain-containing protein [Planctomycetes bacterium]|nr:DUF1080 domain-containing protein [Planctomycetota bacterium]
MKYQTLLMCLVLLAGAGLTQAADQLDVPEGATALFNGKNLEGWYGLGHFNPYKLRAMGDDERAKKRDTDLEDLKKHWTIESGELVNDGHGVYATTDRKLGDMEFWIDYKTVPLADSGIYLRGTPQVQIWDSTEEAKWKIGGDKGSGGLWNNSPGAPGKDPSVLADKPFGEWNSFRIVQVGARTSVTFNDKLVVDHAIMENYWDRSKPLPRTGPVQLQTHGGEIRWRNIFVREIASEEANKRLASKNAEGFESIFNGKDLAGWQGAIENYQVSNGSLSCKSGHGGTLFTKEKYGDFVVRLEFKLPPGGNNGLALRYPGKGGPSVDAMCELQVLDDDHPKYEKLDARQFHGSIYGLVPATRGYLRPTGEWNFQEVTVKGSTIKVELNGSVILDADVSKVTETMDNKVHPGKDLKSGYFGFAGHHDPVEFRNIMIKRLD